MNQKANKSALKVSYIPCPLGYCTFSADSEHIHSISLRNTIPDHPKAENALTRACSLQLNAYFSGNLKTFDLPLNTEAFTPFYQSVWRLLIGIPYGKTASYSDIALALNNPKAVRAVGLANGKNPFTIVIPCHRIIGKNNSITGYAHGVEKKRWLLEHEGALKKKLTLFD